jgi:hypothetical protein
MKASNIKEVANINHEIHRHGKIMDDKEFIFKYH